MTPMHQPVTTTKTNHALTLDDTDVNITRFIEYIECEWLGEWQNLLNFSTVRFDLGHDTLTFTTDSVEVNLINFITKLSSRFPTSFIMYDFYTDVDDEENLKEGRFFFLGGKITTDESELHNIEHEV